MNIEQGYIEKFTEDMLNKYQLDSRDLEVIKYLIQKGIDEKLYTDTKDFQHNLKHVERVIVYARMIMKKMNSNLINEEILMYASLYHDIGKTIGASNKEHGIVGASEFKRKMKGILDDKKINAICTLIYQHADEENKIDFTKSDFTEEEKKSIQLMSDILKDADALDRNRLNYPAPIGTCDKNKLRTNEGKDILELTDSLYQDYCTTIINEREKQSGTKILDNYDKLVEWINAYDNRKNDDDNMMFHASLDPSVDVLIPRRSTQKGEYVYAGIDPISCIKMASFRFSMVFPSTTSNGIRGKKEIFPNSLEETLGSKYITLYKLPKDKFHEYIEPETSAPSREWVSEESVQPTEQISFKALELLDFLVVNKKISIVKDSSIESQISSFLNSFETYIWGINEIKEKPDIFDQKWQLLETVIKYYINDSEKIIHALKDVKNDIDNEMVNYIEQFKNANGREPNYNNQAECITPIKEKFEAKYKTYFEYVHSYLENPNQELNNNIDKTK